MMPSCHTFSQVCTVAVVVQLLSCVWLFMIPRTAAHQASKSFTSPRAGSNSSPLSRWYLPTISSSVIPFSSCLKSFPASGSYSTESTLGIQWPMYWSFSFNISPSNEYSGLISFRIDWLDLLVVQKTLQNLLQHHSSKSSICLCSAFFIIYFSHPSSQWCHSTISSSVIPYSSCLQSILASESFPISQVITSGGQSIGV